MGEKGKRFPWKLGTQAPLVEDIFTYESLKGRPQMVGENCNNELRWAVLVNIYG